MDIILFYLSLDYSIQVYIYYDLLSYSITSSLPVFMKIWICITIPSLVINIWN